MNTPNRFPWRERLIIFVGLLVFYIILGAYLSLVKNYMPYDGLSRLVSAWLVFRGTQVKLATIGFVWPPLPTLLLLPFAWIPALVDSWMAIVIVSALFMALSAVMVGEIATTLGIKNGWKQAIILLFALNPLVVVFAINGMSESILVALTLSAIYYLLRFWKFDRNTDMMLSAFFFSLLPLVRYEFALVSVASGVILAVHCWTQRSNFKPEEFRQFLEGRLLAFSSLAIYPIFLWTLASWWIMGSPIYFMVNDRSAISLAEIQLSANAGLDTGFLGSLKLITGTWFLTFPASVISTIGLFWLSYRKKEVFYLNLSLLPLIIPLLQLFLLNQRSNYPLLRYFMMVVPFGVVTAILLARGLLSVSRNPARREFAVMVGVIVLLLVSNFGTAYMLDAYPYQNIERLTWKALTTNEKVAHREFQDAYRVGQKVREIIPKGSRVLVDTYQFGFGVMLGSRDPALFMDFTDPNYDAAVLNPTEFVDYVLVPTTSQRGAYYSINRFHPGLHDDGAPWAVLVDGLPETTLDWRLYKVKR